MPPGLKSWGKLAPGGTGENFSGLRDPEAGPEDEAGALWAQRKEEVLDVTHR